jgi:hypothetical protein
MELAIHPEIEALCPPLTADERMGLEESLLAEGCREALAVWEDAAGLRILLDGHNRFALCRQHDLAFTVVVIEAVRTLTDAKVWVIKNQFARRNLTPYQRAELALALEPLIAAQARARQGRRHDLSENCRKAATPLHTDVELGRLAGVSDTTMRKAKVIAREADEPTKAALRRGERSVHGVYVDLRPPKPKADGPTPLDVWLKLVREVASLVDSLDEQGGLTALCQRWGAEGRAQFLGELEDLLSPLIELRDELRAACATVDVETEGE